MEEGVRGESRSEKPGAQVGGVVDSRAAPTKFLMEGRTPPENLTRTVDRRRMGRAILEICMATNPHQRIFASTTSTETGYTPTMVGNSVEVSQTARYGSHGGEISQ